MPLAVRNGELLGFPDTHGEGQAAGFLVVCCGIDFAHAGIKAGQYARAGVLVGQYVQSGYADQREAGCQGQALSDAAADAQSREGTRALAVDDGVKILQGMLAVGQQRAQERQGQFGMALADMLVFVQERAVNGDGQ